MFSKRKYEYYKGKKSEKYISRNSNKKGQKAIKQNEIFITIIYKFIYIYSFFSYSKCTKPTFSCNFEI